MKTHKTMTPSRNPIRTNPSRKCAPVEFEDMSSTTISNDHISNNDNKSKSTAMSPLELQHIYYTTYISYSNFQLSSCLEENRNTHSK